MADHLSTSMTCGTYGPDPEEHLRLNYLTDTATGLALLGGIARLNPTSITGVAWGIAVDSDFVFTTVYCVQEINLKANGQVAASS